MRRSKLPIVTTADHDAAAPRNGALLCEYVTFIPTIVLHVGYFLAHAFVLPREFLQKERFDPYVEHLAEIQGRHQLTIHCGVFNTAAKALLVAVECADKAFLALHGAGGFATGDKGHPGIIDWYTLAEQYGKQCAIYDGMKGREWPEAAA